MTIERIKLPEGMPSGSEDIKKWWDSLTQEQKDAQKLIIRAKLDEIERREGWYEARRLAEKIAETRFNKL